MKKSNPGAKNCAPSQMQTCKYCNTCFHTQSAYHLNLAQSSYIFGYEPDV